MCEFGDQAKTVHVALPAHILAHSALLGTPWSGQEVGGSEAADPAHALVSFRMTHLRAVAGGDVTACAHTSSIVGIIGTADVVDVVLAHDVLLVPQERGGCLAASHHWLAADLVTRRGGPAGWPRADLATLASRVAPPPAQPDAPPRPQSSFERAGLLIGPLHKVRDERKLLVLASML